MTEKNHIFWMILACIIPLLIVLLLPVFGIRSKYTIFIAMILMIVVHIFMMKNHNHNKHQN